MLKQQVRQALGLFRKRPGVAAVAVVTLALGIGANTAIFSVLDTLLLRPLPYPESESLVAPVFARKTGTRWRSATYPDFVEWRRQRDLFEHVAGYYQVDRDLTGSGEPATLSGLLVTEDYFPLTRARPVLGRTLEADDYRAGAEKVVVLDSRLWRSRCGGRQDIVGSTIRLHDELYTVVGVVETRDTIPSGSEFWTPLDLGRPVPEDFLRRDNYFLATVARLRPGVGIETARSRVASLARRVAEDFPTKRGEVGASLITLKEELIGSEPRRVLLLVFATVLLVMVIACVNVANLLLVRSVERRREMAVRMALGAGHGHLLRLLTGESLALAAVSGLAGVGVAGLGMAALRRLAPPEFPGIDRISLDASVLGFAVALSFVTALVFGLLPARQLGQSNVGDELRDFGAGHSGGGRRGQRLRNGLVVGEIVLCLVVLVSAGLMIRSLDRLTTRDVGVRLQHRLTAGLNLPRARYPERAQRNAFFDTLLARLRAHPQVRRAAASSSLPLGAGGDTVRRAHLVENQPEPPAGPEHRAMWNVVTPDYFRAIGMPLLRGRAFTDRDSAESTPVMIVNQAFAEEVSPGRDPVGLRVRSWRDENVLREIVGVVGSVRYRGSGDEWTPMVYVPHTQVGWPRLRKVVIETAGDPVQLAAAVRSGIWHLDDRLPLGQITTLGGIAAVSVARERHITWLLGGFGGLALLLAALGIYGVVSYSVSQRTVEMGVRVALGATPRHVFGLVLRQGLGLALVGGALGILAALAASRGFSGLLTDVSPADPLTYVAAAGVLLLVTVVSSLGPARRAVQVPPVEALKHE
jgi:putative ABC transport system permease protein